MFCVVRGAMASNCEGKRDSDKTTGTYDAHVADATKGAVQEVQSGSRSMLNPLQPPVHSPDELKELRKTLFLHYLV